MAIHGEAADIEPAAALVPDRTPDLAESRWPPIAATLVFMALNIALRLWLPTTERGETRLPWLVPAVEAVLVVILATAHPGGAAEHRRMRRIGLTVVGILVVAALWATAVLVDDLVRGTGVSGSPSRLLASGAVVWLGWLMDGGGPVARRRRPVPIDFAFTQHMSPELAPPGWRPVFLDYLHLGFTNATAFSPTDVMPLTHRAKYAMLVQATVALALFGLVVARAVNAFTSSPVRSGGADLHPHEVMPRAGAVQSIGGPPPPMSEGDP